MMQSCVFVCVRAHDADATVRISLPLPPYHDMNSMPIPNILECVVRRARAHSHTHKLQTKTHTRVLNLTHIQYDDENKPMPPEAVLSKHCALVGSWGGLTGLGYGPEIDAIDSVWRMNGSPWRGYEADVGSRTDVRVVARNAWGTLESMEKQAGFHEVYSGETIITSDRAKPEAPEDPGYKEWGYLNKGLENVRAQGASIFVYNFTADRTLEPIVLEYMRLSKQVTGEVRFARVYECSVYGYGCSLHALTVGRRTAPAERRSQSHHDGIFDHLDHAELLRDHYGVWPGPAARYAD